MIGFFLVALVLVAGALLFVLPPLLRKKTASGHTQRDALNLAVLRDQLRELDADLAAGTIDAAGHAAARSELERRVAEDVQPEAPVSGAEAGRRPMALALGLVVPLLAVALYAWLGTPAALDGARRAPAASDQSHDVSQEQLAAMVDGLAKRLQGKPDDLEGWGMLARSYSAMGNFKGASDAYAHLVKVAPRNADYLTDYADALAMSLGKTMQGEPERLVERALVVDPGQIKALLLYGSAAFERHDYPAAIARWKKILPLVPPDSEVARSTLANIGEAQGLAGMPQTMPAVMAGAAAASFASAPASPAAAPAGHSVSGTVELDPALRAKVADGDTVFIFARAAQGPRFPLAALRRQVADLPVSFTLDDSMSVVAGNKLSDFPQVVVGARISKSGSATPAAGDFEGLGDAVAPGATGLKIRINSVRK